MSTSFRSNSFNEFLLKLRDLTVSCVECKETKQKFIGIKSHDERKRVESKLNDSLEPRTNTMGLSKAKRFLRVTRKVHMA